jgi:hypothetical protein
MKLMSMVDFVLKQKEELKLRANLHYYVEAVDLAWKMINYAQFLKQPLELWMFVPCDENGNVLEDKTYFPIIDCEYQQAKEVCIFYGFEFTESQKFSTVNNIKNSVHWYTKDRLYLTTKKEDGYHSYFQLFTVEDLIQCDLQLTPTALKQIGL